MSLDPHEPPSTLPAADPVFSPAAAPSAVSDPGRDMVYVLGQIGGAISLAFGGLALLLALIPFLNVVALILAFWGLMAGFLSGGFLYFGRRGRLLLPILGLLLNSASVAVFILVYLLLALLAAASA